MPPKQGKRKNKKARGSSKRGPAETPSKAIVYNGPIVLRQAMEERTLHSLQLVQELQLSSSSGGLITNVFPSNPNGTSDWSSLAVAFDEYRTLGFEVMFFPDNRYSKTTTNCTPLAVVIDRDNSTALSSYTIASQYESCTFKSIEDPWVRSVKMCGIEDSSFINTSSPVPTFYMKLYGQNYSTSTAYGLILIKYLVQFRGIGV